MKLRKQMEILMNGRNRKYWIAGIVCMVLAGVLLTINMGGFVNAAGIMLGNSSFQLDMENGAYVIRTKEQLAALGRATAEETGGKRFILAGDMEIAEINSVANGNFAGVFDGQGHVITIQNVNLPVNSENGQVSHGILFGTVSGEVSDFIVDIQNEVSYERISKSDSLGAVKDSAMTISGNDAQPPYTGMEFSIYSDDSLARRLAQELSGASQITGGDNNTYRRLGQSESVIKTDTYNPGAAGTDQFGIVCGLLEESASISRVYIKGDTLKVTQKADMISVKRTQEGIRDRYFYYSEVIKNVEKQDVTNLSALATTVNGSTTVYPSGIKATGEDTLGNVAMKVYAPKYFKKGEKPTFELEVKNGEVNQIKVMDRRTDAATPSGKWTYENGTDVSGNDLISNGTTQKYKYELNNEVTTSGVSATFEVDVSGNDIFPGNETLTASVSSIAVDTEEAATRGTAGTDLQLTLDTGKKNYLVDASSDLQVSYELTIKSNAGVGSNKTKLTISASDITLKINGVTSAVVWKTEAGVDFTSKEIQTGEEFKLNATVTLPRTAVMTMYNVGVTVTPSDRKIIYENAKVYSYVADTAGITNLDKYGAFDGQGNPETEEAADTYAGNHLNAGIFVGTSKGSITECKQEMNISKIQDSTTVLCGEELLAGGVVGKALSSAEASDLYLLKEPGYSGENAALPEHTLTSSGASMPGNGKWTAYVSYDSQGSEKASFDLSWLVKTKAESDFGSQLSGSIITLNYAGAPMTSKTLSYQAAYNARKSMTDNSEDNVYVAVDGKLDLGDSGFYRLLHIYATDGYYHYITPKTELKDAAWRYPYSANQAQNPYLISDGSVTVVRQTNPLQDVVQINLAAGAQNGDEVYYAEKDTNELPHRGGSFTANEVVSKNGIVQLPFEKESIQYRVVLVVGGHIYPAQTIREVVQSERLPLPRLQVECYNYYDLNSQKNAYVSFVENTAYEAGTDMRFVPADDVGNEEGYTFRYLYSTAAPEAGKWDGENRFTGSDTEFMDAAASYSGSAVIPKNLENEDTVYLYVEVSKKNYDTQIYYYGPFAVREAVELNAKLTTNGSELSGNTVVDGDIVMLSGAPLNTTVQYMLSQEAAVSNYVWTDYTDSGIVMNRNKGCYIYARINLGNGKYSEPDVFVYNQASLCADIRVTPNTGLSSGGEAAAATISSTNVISLASRTPGAEVFYWVTESPNPVSMERVSGNVDSAITDGTVSAEGYKYFKVGNRWYRTNNQEVERFTQGISLSHDKKTAQLIYVSAIAIADGYEASQATEYIYKVEPKQQVSAPEATFETRYMPGGDSVEISTVAPNSTVSFYSVTPEAELYYSVGTGTGAPTTPMPDTGVIVQGEYGSNFIVRVQARRKGMQDSEIVTFVYSVAYQETVNAPTATPGTTKDVPTVVIPGNKILLSSTTTGAAIYYTTDGSTPMLTENADGSFSAADANTLLYDPNAGIMMPLDGKGYFAITAVAVKTGLEKSAEVHFTYAYPGTVLEPYSNVDSGMVELNTNVHLKNLTTGAVIYYTAAYGDNTPAEPTFSSSVFSEEHPFVITQKITIKAMAAKDGVKSKVVTFIFEPMKQLEVPKPSIESGSVVSRGTVLSLRVADGVTVHYTLDGSDPMDSKNTAVMTGTSLILNGEPGGQVTIKAYATAAGMSKSEVITLTYQFSQSVGGITASLPSGSIVANGTKVNLLSDITGAEIYYTTDGSSPIDDGEKGTVVVINGVPGTNFMIKAVAYTGGTAGNIVTFSYIIKDKPAAPTASPGEGTLTVATRVSLYSGAAQIYYTTDGTEPTKSSNLYTEPILINSTTTLKAIAVSANGEVSDVASFLYKASSRPEKPQADCADTQVLEPGTRVMLQTGTSGARIYYTTDGTDPTLDRLDSLLEYDGDGIEISRSVTIKAVAYREDMRLSEVATWNYFVETIPAVEKKKAEEAKKAEEGLQDTDTGALVRNNHREESEDSRTIQEKEYQTTVTFTEGELVKNVELKALEGDIDSASVSYTKSLFGEDYTILSTYYMWLKSGETYVQPTGEVEVGIPIPEGYENAALTVVQVDGNNKVVALNTTRTAGMLYAKTDAIGKCAIVGPETVEKTTRSISYLLILEILAGVTLAGGTGYFMVELIKKWNKTKKTTQTSDEKTNRLW